MNEIETLYRQHAFDSPAVDAWIDDNYADIETVRAFGPIAEMRGTFTPAKISYIYKWQFTPNKNGPHRAIVMAVLEEGRMVDIVAWRAGGNRKKLDVWGCVTHSGRFLNRDAIYETGRAEPLRIHEHWWQWLRAGCSGVVPLRVSAIPELCNAGDVVVGDSSHALQLLYET